MLITPALLRVKTHVGRGRQETANGPRLLGARGGFLVEGMTADDILAQLDVPVMVRGPEATEWDCIRNDHAAMAEAGEWDDLLEALRFADQERRVASGGRRVAFLISEGARARLSAALTAGDAAEAEAELRRFEAVFALHADDYCAAHLLAEAHLAMTGFGDTGSGGLNHVAAAEVVLSDFDPFEEMSPLLAASRYRLLPALADGPELCRDWYEDWCDLDPEDAMAHAAHAAFLLRLPGPSAARVEKAARRAMVLTGQIAGKSAYAVFHMAARDNLGVVITTADLEMLLPAVMDFAAATGCQHRANLAANFLTEVLGDFRAFGPVAAVPQSRIKSALSDVILNHLRELHVESWSRGADGIAEACGEVFGPALRRGARIQLAGSGLGARVPRD